MLVHDKVLFRLFTPNTFSTTESRGTEGDALLLGRVLGVVEGHELQQVLADPVGGEVERAERGRRAVRRQRGCAEREQSIS